MCIRLGITVSLILLAFMVHGQIMMGVHYQHGYNVPVYTLSPETERWSPFVAVDLRWKESRGLPLIREFYGAPDIHIHAFFQNLGNDDVMGYALGFVPEIMFSLGGRGRSSWYGGGGLGAAWTNKPFDKADNATNQALGTPWNIYAQAHIRYHYTLNKDWELTAEFGIHHMSNSFFSYPNLGVNIPSAGLGLYYVMSRPDPDAYEKPDLVEKTRWRPFVRGIYGITERAFDGPKFAVLGFGAGMYKWIAPHRSVSLGGEYMFDESNFYFVSRASGNPGEETRDQARRYMLFAGHEYYFGYFSLLTEAGVYLTKHYNRQSAISTKVGLNFYPFNNFFKKRHQLSVGAFIRAYFLRADFFELSVNYRI